MNCIKNYLHVKQNMSPNIAKLCLNIHHNLQKLSFSEVHIWAWISNYLGSVLKAIYILKILQKKMNFINYATDLELFRKKSWLKNYGSPIMVSLLSMGDVE